MTKLYHQKSGNCFSFNTGINDILKTSVTGDRHGLKLELVVSKLQVFGIIKNIIKTILI